MQLLSVEVNGTAIAVSSDEIVYRTELGNAANASAFVDFLTVVKYLTFFNEERRDILWDDQAQRQFFRILFSTPTEALQWIELEQEISRADSRARNHSASAFQFEGDLRKLEALLVNNAGVTARLQAEQSLLDADMHRRNSLQSSSADQEMDLQALRRDLERTKLVEADARRGVEEIRFSKLDELFPKWNDTARYIYTQLFSDGRCLACEQHTDRALQLEKLLADDLCVVCGSDLKASPVPHIHNEKRVERDLKAALAAMEAATVQKIALHEAEATAEQAWRATLTELATVTTSINQRLRDTSALRKQLPPDPADIAQLRVNIEQLRKSQRQEEEKRQSAEAVYEQLLVSVNSRIETATGRVATIFQDLIKRFLEESCTLSYTTVRDRPSQGGRQFLYPSLRFEMSAAAFEGQQVRATPDDVSESQRQFIDLAFRMALMEAGSQDGAISLVIETPEASLDAIFMGRAAAMFREFAKGERSVVVTSNLTSSVMIPALMGNYTDDAGELEKRQTRVLNLLKVAAPNAAVMHHRDQYLEFLDQGIRGQKS
ncbi:hypothetical protein [Mesorhizobium sp. M1396]|uniref:hypothetical protein n=1 Tax=Mesorhizobium sp. M1396 TaxID=2957095 RepID=UPI003339E652